MKVLLSVWREEDGVLSFEWTLLVTLLTIGIVSGLAGARDSIIDELGDVAEAAQGIDQSYSLMGVNIPGVFVTPDSVFIETAPIFTDCGRAGFDQGQGPAIDVDS